MRSFVPVGRHTSQSSRLPPLLSPPPHSLSSSHLTTARSEHLMASLESLREQEGTWFGQVELDECFLVNYCLFPPLGGSTHEKSLVKAAVGTAVLVHFNKAADSSSQSQLFPTALNISLGLNTLWSWSYLGHGLMDVKTRLVDVFTLTLGSAGGKVSERLELLQYYVFLLAAHKGVNQAELCTALMAINKDHCERQKDMRNKIEPHK